MEDFTDALVDSVLVLPASGLEHEFKVLLHGPVSQELEILENDPNLTPEIRYLLVLQAIEFVAAHFAETFFERILGDDRPDDGCLSGSDLAYDVDEIPRKHFHVKAVDDHVLAVQDVGVPEGNQRLAF